MKKYVYGGTALLVTVLIAVVFPHAVGWFIGIYPVPSGTSVMYQLWSGFLPACAIISVVWPFVNCHVEGCPRYGRYRVAEFRCCRTHHPDENVREGKITREHLMHLHNRGIKS